MSTSQEKEGLWAMTVGEREASLRVLEKGISKGGGSPRKIFDRLRTDQRFASDVASFMLKASIEGSVQHNRVCEIMGGNFFGIEQAVRYFNVKPTRQQISALSEIPFSEEELQESKDTHVLVAVFPLSILKIRAKVQGKGLFYGQSWYKNEPFAKERGKASWQLVRKTPVDNSFSKNWEEQLALIGEDDEVPSAQLMVYTIIGQYLAAGERLFEDVYVRTSSLPSVGYRVYVGDFGSEGLGVSCYWDDDRYYGVGLAASRKFKIDP